MHVTPNLGPSLTLFLSKSLLGLDRPRPKRLPRTSTYTLIWLEVLLGTDLACPKARRVAAYLAWRLPRPPLGVLGFSGWDPTLVKFEFCARKFRKSAIYWPQIGTSALHTTAQPIADPSFNYIVFALKRLSCQLSSVTWGSVWSISTWVAFFLFYSVNLQCVLFFSLLFTFCIIKYVFLSCKCLPERKNKYWKWYHQRST